MLAIIIEHAINDGQIEGVVPHLVDGGLSILQKLMIQLYLWNMTLKKLEI
jgi:hypothetical protein